eukprot:1591021-Amphidinium_carterae.1
MFRERIGSSRVLKSTKASVCRDQKPDIHAGAEVYKGLFMELSAHIKLLFTGLSRDIFIDGILRDILIDGILRNILIDGIVKEAVWVQVAQFCPTAMQIDTSAFFSSQCSHVSHLAKAIEIRFSLSRKGLWANAEALKVEGIEKSSDATTEARSIVSGIWAELVQHREALYAGGHSVVVFTIIYKLLPTLQSELATLLRSAAASLHPQGGDTSTFRTPASEAEP